MKKPEYSLVNLKVSWNDTDPCEIGDELVTRTGRRYQVMEISGKSFTCMVLPEDASVQSKQWCLTWNRRKK